MQINLVQPRHVEWRPEHSKRVDESPILNLCIRPIQWSPAPKISASVEYLEGDDARREWHYFGGAA